MLSLFKYSRQINYNRIPIVSEVSKNRHIRLKNVLYSQAYQRKTMFSKSFQPSSSQCSGQGTLVCGVCSCEDGYVGSKCECRAETTPMRAGKVDESSCRMTQSSEVCSGQGSCICGQCECNEGEISSEVSTYKF